jgi:hypothetical protein
MQIHTAVAHPIFTVYKCLDGAINSPNENKSHWINNARDASNMHSLTHPFHSRMHQKITKRGHISQNH